MVGWGRTVEDDPASMPKDLLQLDSHLLLYSDCHFGDDYDATPGDVCVELPKGGVAGPCNGDSGSPLLWKVNGVWRIVGARQPWRRRDRLPEHPRGVHHDRLLLGLGARHHQRLAPRHIQADWTHASRDVWVQSA